MRAIDLNADIGEGAGEDDVLLNYVTSVSIACGGHAGDEESMRRSIVLAVRRKARIGAHPSYPDPEGFGRRSLDIDADTLKKSLISQIEALIAAADGASIDHVKPHGALYNDAARDPFLAFMLAAAVYERLGRTALMGPPGSMLENAAQESGLGFVAEGFVDRAYLRDGALAPRSQPDAVIEDMQARIEQGVNIAQGRPVDALGGASIDIDAQTLCIHGDSKGAGATARRLREALEHNGISVRAYDPF